MLGRGTEGTRHRVSRTAGAMKAAELSMSVSSLGDYSKAIDVRYVRFWGKADIAPASQNVR